MEADQQLIEAGARLLASARLLVVFTGAGVSRESGIPTFRDPVEGIWAKYDPMWLATMEGYLHDPPLVWRWYEQRFGVVAQTEPNPEHRAIAELEQLIPRVVVVTQNIDGLHQRAGSSEVVALHGSMLRYQCLSGRHTGFTRADFAGQAEQPPRCPSCGEILRPDVVWFGEALPDEDLGYAFDLAQTCDAMLVVGTSGLVYPAAGLPGLASRSGVPVVEINPTPTQLSASADHLWRTTAALGLPALVDAALG